MGRPLDSHTAQQILDAYKEGEKLAVIVRAYNVSKCTVQKYARNAGVTRPSGRPRKA